MYSQCRKKSNISCWGKKEEDGAQEMGENTLRSESPRMYIEGKKGIERRNNKDRKDSIGIVSIGYG